ncbi:MAG: hypothetical protein K6T26_07705 [Alicyclobacillus sp.]|nr:hypothetical protein [Alicyclobacillus sp.]
MEGYSLEWAWVPGELEDLWRWNQLGFSGWEMAARAEGWPSGLGCQGLPWGDGWTVPGLMTDGWGTEGVAARTWLNGDWSGAYPLLAPYHPWPTWDMAWLDPWAMQPYHGVWS